MKTKITISLYIVFSFCTLIVGQNKIDTTAYYMQFENKDYIRAVEYCISDLKKWNQVNYPQGGIIIVKINPSDVDNCVLNVSEVFTMSDIYHTLPDYYSYLSGAPILWVTGKKYLEKENNIFQEFVLHKFEKYLYDDLIYNNIPDPNDSNKLIYEITTRYSNNISSKKANSNDKFQSFTIPENLAKKIKTTNIDIPNKIINFSMSYIIKKNRNKITINKNKNVYQYIIVSKN